MLDINWIREHPGELTKAHIARGFTAEEHEAMVEAIRHPAPTTAEVLAQVKQFAARLETLADDAHAAARTANAGWECACENGRKHAFRQVAAELRVIIEAAKRTT